MGNLVPLSNDVTAVCAAAVRQTGEQNIAVHEMLPVKQQVVAVQIEHRELHVDPLDDLSVANGQVAVSRSIGNAIAKEPNSYTEEIEQAGGNGSIHVSVLSCAVIKGAKLLELQVVLRLCKLDRARQVVSVHVLRLLFGDKGVKRRNKRIIRVTDLGIRKHARIRCRHGTYACQTQRQGEQRQIDISHWILSSMVLSVLARTD